MYFNVPNRLEVSLNDKLQQPSNSETDNKGNYKLKLNQDFSTLIPNAVIGDNGKNVLDRSTNMLIGLFVDSL